MNNTNISDKDAKTSLAAYLEVFRIDRPSEWQMDNFIQRANEMESVIANMQKTIDEQQALIEKMRESLSNIFQLWNEGDTSWTKNCDLVIEDCEKALALSSPVSEKAK